MVDDDTVVVCGRCDKSIPRSLDFARLWADSRTANPRSSAHRSSYEPERKRVVRETLCSSRSRVSTPIALATSDPEPLSRNGVFANSPAWRGLRRPSALRCGPSPGFASLRPPAPSGSISASTPVLLVQRISDFGIDPIDPARRSLSSMHNESGRARWPCPRRRRPRRYRVTQRSDSPSAARQLVAGHPH